MTMAFPDPSSASSSQQPPLFHLSVNPSAPTTVVLLHGLLSSHLEYALVTPHLARDYHVLLVDLPGHSRSASPRDDDGDDSSNSSSSRLTIPAMADAVASIIRQHAHPSPSSSSAGGGGGAAHVVGLSMGGFVALDLARRHPGLCLSVFATGAAPFEGAFRFLAARPWIVYALMGLLLDWTPAPVYWWMVRVGWGGVERRFEELRGEMRANRRWAVVRAVYGSILASVGWDEVRAVDAVRVLCVAAGKQDDVEATRRVGEVWRREGIAERLGSRAVVVRGAVHAWNLQFPELFAQGVRAWIEGTELPKEFESL